VKVCSFHFSHDITGVHFTLANNGQNAKLQYPFPHLTLCVINIHLWSFWPLAEPWFFNFRVYNSFCQVVFGKAFTPKRPFKKELLPFDKTKMN